MTSVGKILVLLIMAFSLVFLALSTIVFVTAKNWMVATKKERAEVEKLKKKVTETVAQVDASKKSLEDAKTAFDEQLKQLTNLVSSLQDQNNHNIDELTKVRSEVVTARQTAKSSLDEVEAKRQETSLLRTQKSAVEKQANEFKLRQAELNDQIRELERKLETATKNNSNLRERSRSSQPCCAEPACLTTSARSRGWRARRRSRDWSNALTPPIGGSKSRSAPTTGLSSVTSSSCTASVRARNTWVRSRSFTSIPTRPSAR